MSRFDPWAETTETGSDPQLERVLVERIAAAGPIPFAEFMAQALYHPAHGYYATPASRIGRAGDYVTSPEAHPVFGGLVARQLAQFWELLGRPPSFRIVEAGAGNGTLARDVAAALGRIEPQARLDYVIVEPHPFAAARQRETLRVAREAGLRASWCDDLEAIPAAGATVVLSNELLDAFPVHRVVVRQGRLREVYVDYDTRQGFVEREGDPSTPELDAYFARLGLAPGEGCAAEVNLEAPRWMAQAARVVERGFVLTFDYGAGAAELYAPWRHAGTLLCFHNHVAGQNPYVRIGVQDITAHVDFTTLVAAGRAAGLEPLGFARQSEVLTALGIGEGLASPGEGALALERHMGRRQAALELLDPAGLGRIRVLAQGRGVGRPALVGFPGGAALP